MKPDSRVVERLSPLLESKPVIALCLSGTQRLGDSIKKAGFNASLKRLDFNFHDWTDSHVIVKDKKKPGVSKSMGRKPSELKEVAFLLSLFLKQKSKEFALSKENNYVVFQEVTRTGKSLATVKTALEMNGIPKNNVTTVAMTSSIKPLFVPDVIGEKTFVKPHQGQKKSDWLRLEHPEKHFLINVPTP
jgi:hypothetical protein